MIFSNIFLYLIHANKQRRALIIYNPTDSFFTECFGEYNMKPIYEKSADHLLGPINALRQWSRNFTKEGESFFDITIFTRIKYSANRAGFIAHQREKKQIRYLCNLEGTSLYPNISGKGPRCCNVYDQDDKSPQGEDIFKGNFCGCPTHSIYWKSRQCRFLEEGLYWPYVSVVEHGGTNITPYIDGPRGKQFGDHVVDIRFGYFEGGHADGGLFFPHLGEDLDNPKEVEFMIREDGKYLQKPTYKILKEANVTELYFSGYSDWGIRHAIKEAQAVGYSNITLISDAFNGAMWDSVGITHEEKINYFLITLQKHNVTVRTAKEIVENANLITGQNKKFEIHQPPSIGRENIEPKRALIILNVQDNLLSTCNNNKNILKTLTDSHRIIIECIS